MRSGYTWRRRIGQALAVAGLAVAAAAPARAQSPGCCPPPCQPNYPIPSVTMPPWSPGTDATQPPAAGQPSADMSAQGSVAPEGSALALSGNSVATEPGYVDFAVPISQVRLRYDAAWGDNRPDRAEFFYAKCGCFRSPQNPNVRAPGPPLAESNVDYQELRPYAEVAFGTRFSVFLEAPVRFINPEQNTNEAGFGNLIAGFKYAFVAQPDQYLTFQFLTSTPTGDAFRGLGNDLTAVEPGVLWYRQLSDRLAFSGEVRDWIPINGTDFAGNVLRTGGALSYTAYNSCSFRVTPIGEVVGWYVLGGQELAVDNAGQINAAGQQVGVAARQLSASGDTIVNAKIGVRLGFGPLVGPANVSRSDLYIGYGRALTGEVWYKDILRVEYALRF